MSDDKMSDENSNGTDASMQGPAKKPRRWVRWALVASLALNVLFVGFAVSRAYHFSGKHWGGKSPVVQVMREGRKFVWDLPRERRRELGKMIKARRDEFRPDDAEVKAAVRAFAEAIQETPYDAKRTEDALVKLQDQAELLITRGRAVSMDIVAELSKDEREQLAKRLLSKSGE